MGAIKRAFANNITTSGNLTALNAANLTGTIADARFPATLPAISGVNLTGISSDFVHIKTLTAGGVSSLDFIHGTNSVVLDSTYTVYKIIGHRVDFGSNQGLACRFRVGGSFITSSSYETQSASLRGNNSAFDISGGALTNTYIRMGWQRYTGTTTGFSANFESTFYNLSSTAKDKHMITIKVGNGNTTDDAVWQIASGTLDTDSARTNAVDGLRFTCADFSTNFSGSFALYGIKDS